MLYSYLIISEDNDFIIEIKGKFKNFLNYSLLGVFKDDENIITVFENLAPDLVFFSLPFSPFSNGLNFSKIADSFQYLNKIPYFIGISNSQNYAFEAYQAGISNYLTLPIQIDDFGKCLFRFEKGHPPKMLTSICVKSYTDYQFVHLDDILYLKADNNTTDIKMTNGKIVNAYKTLKYFEQTLPIYFIRIHKSYIVNSKQVSRIQLSKSKCYLNYDMIIPFSLGYRKKVEELVIRLKNN